MKQYEARFLDRRGHIDMTMAISSDDDTHAIGKCQDIFNRGIGTGVELWDGIRLAYKEMRQSNSQRMPVRKSA